MRIVRIILSFFFAFILGFSSHAYGQRAQAKAHVEAGFKAMARALPSSLLGTVFNFVQSSNPDPTPLLAAVNAWQESERQDPGQPTAGAKRIIPEPVPTSALPDELEAFAAQVSAPDMKAPAMHEIVYKLDVLAHVFEPLGDSYREFETATKLVHHDLLQYQQGAIREAVNEFERGTTGELKVDEIHVENHTYDHRIKIRLIHCNGQIRPGLSGVQGYQTYADVYNHRTMRAPQVFVSKALGKTLFRTLGWGQVFRGKTKEYRQTRGRVLDEAGKPLPDMMGPLGYVRYADTYDTDGDMRKAFVNASAVLTPREFEDLGWGKQFQGKTKEYRQIRGRVLDETGNPLPDMMGPLGYVRYADTYTDGGMKKAFINVSAVLTPREFEDLGWGKQFDGKTKEYRQTRSRVLDEAGKPLPGMVDPAGYILYADTYTNGEMRKAFANASAVLTLREFEDLGWGKVFRGKTKEYRQTRSRVLDEAGKPLPDMTGLLGYVRYADNYADGDMYKAFVNASAVLTPREFKDLGWGKVFHGKTKEYRQIRGRVLDETGNPLPDMMGPLGYVRYADMYYTDRDMRKAFANASAVLTPREFEDLGWGKTFQGNTREYAWYRSQIVQAGGGINPEFRNNEGLQRLVNHIIRVLRLRSNTAPRVRQNSRVVLTASEIEASGWPKSHDRRTKPAPTLAHSDP